MDLNICREQYECLYNFNRRTMKKQTTKQATHPKMQERSSFTVLASLLGQKGSQKTLIFNTMAEIPHDKKQGQLANIQKLLKFQINQKHQVFIKLQHPAGQQKFDSIPKMMYNGVNVFILVFICSRIESFYALEKEIKDIHQRSDVKNIYLFLLGVDDGKQCKIPKQKLQDFIKKHDIMKFQKLDPNEPLQVKNALKSIAISLNQIYIQQECFFGQLNKQTIIITKQSNSQQKRLVQRPKKCCL